MHNFNICVHNFMQEPRRSLGWKVEVILRFNTIFKETRMLARSLCILLFLPCEQYFMNIYEYLALMKA